MNLTNGSRKKDQIFEAWFRDHYFHLILGFLFIFVSLPFIAPILLKSDIVLPAKAIYWIDSFFCHQLPYRSWFLFGAQPFYPLEGAGLKNIVTFEEYFHPETSDFQTIRYITGNSLAGFKMAICQRDIAMYFSLLVFGLVFYLKNKKIKKIPFWIWIVFGVLPLGIDGISQYLDNTSLPLLGTIMHESTPLLRTITGSMFGLFTGWYVFPALESEINKKNISDPEL